MSISNEDYLLYLEHCHERYINNELPAEIEEMFRTQLPDIFAKMVEGRAYKYMMEFKEAYLKGEMDPDALEVLRQSEVEAVHQMLQEWETEKQELLADQNPGE